jgi:exodeoxyribonuclease VII large subunit
MPDPSLLSVDQMVYTVAELSYALKATVEETFGWVRVRGEASGCKRHTSGHLYFNLKDADAVLSAVCWRGVAAGLKVVPEDGLELICSGRLSTYPGRSNYQMIVERVELAGQGALLALLEKRRQQLTAEGLFDTARKRELPFLPQVIGVVTSPTGAVIRDILHRLRERFPCHVLIWPVAVQGEGAAAQIAAAIRGFDALPATEWPETAPLTRPDVLIVARGGGSLEDLWAFNEEIVVRAVANCSIPVITAVGHETDTTLVDFAADRRAPTPTAAAEMATPVRSELLAGIESLRQRLSIATGRMLGEHTRQLDQIATSLRHPRQQVELGLQRLDDWTERLDRATRQHLQETERRLAEQARLLDCQSYERILERGFALISDSDGHPVTAAADARAEMQVRFHDGAVQVRRL